jgi:hypothetical protein
MRVRRNVSSIPCRSASETWREIVDLITGSGSVDVKQLQDASGVLASIITDENPSKRAITVEGVGAQLRVYCMYGMEALEEGRKLDSLTWNPTAGDWTMHVPCDAENMAWVKSALAASSPRIKVFDVEEEDRAAEEEDSISIGKRSDKVVVDWDLKG